MWGILAFLGRYTHVLFLLPVFVFLLIVCAGQCKSFKWTHMSIEYILFNIFTFATSILSSCSFGVFPGRFFFFSFLLVICVAV